MSNKYGLVLVVFLLVALTACGPSEKEVALSDEVAQLTETRQSIEWKRAEKQLELDQKQTELEEIKATPAGALCVARLIVDVDGVEQASDAELQKGEELYLSVTENHSDSEFAKEAKKTYKAIREERVSRQVAAIDAKLDDIRKTSDSTLENCEEGLQEIISSFEDTKGVKAAKTLLRNIEREWRKRGKPVNPKTLAKDKSEYAGEYVRFDSYVVDMGSQVGLHIGDTGRAFMFSAMSFLFSAQKPATYDPTGLYDPLASYEKFTDAITRGSSCTAVCLIGHDGGATIIRLTLEDGTIYDFNH